MPVKPLTNSERKEFDFILMQTGGQIYEEDLLMIENDLNHLFAVKYAYTSPMTRKLRSMQRGNVSPRRTTTPKRKLSAWNKFVKANSKKKIYQYANGKLKLKKMGIAFRKTPAGRKK